jgi:hypothetical protein
MDISLRAIRRPSTSRFLTAGAGNSRFSIVATTRDVTRAIHYGVDPVNPALTADEASWSAEIVLGRQDSGG